MKLLVLTLFSMTSVLMAEDKPHLSPNPSVANPAIEVLVQENNLDSLAEVVEHSPDLDLRFRAISLIGVSDKRHIAALLQILRNLNVEILAGGTEDVIVNRDLKTALMNEIAPALRLNSPPDASFPQVTVFITEADERIQERSSSVHDSGEVDRSARRPDLSPGEPQSAAREAPAAKPAVSTPTKEPALATRPIIAVSIVAAIGLLWWLLKGRK